MEKISGITAIAFDGDGTLWDFQKVMRHSLGFVLEELEAIDPFAASQLDIDKMIDIRNRVAGELKGKVVNLEEIRLAAFKQTLTDVDRRDDALAAHLNAVYLKHRFEDIELFEDVVPVLETLRNKYTIGLLSNGNTYPENCGLEGMFSFVVFSQDCGVEKPDSAIFRIAAGKAGCPPERMLNVGDSPVNDISGARNAGMQAVWLNRTGTKPPSDVKIDYEIQSLTQLLDLL